MSRVLIIDDDRFTQNLLKQSLSQHYETRTANDGAMGLKAASDWHPDIVLLDVDMPGQNGYEICDCLKRNEKTKDIPVLFLSGRSSLRERMLGFEVGADDFLSKPCEPDYLRSKIRKIAEQYEQRQVLTETVAQAKATALEAMSTNFEMGKAIRFVEQSYNQTAFEKLAEALLRSVDDLQLAATVMMPCQGKHEFFSLKDHQIVAGCSPIEEDLLKMMHNDQRFNDFGCRTVVNFPNIGLLIKNMPLDDRSRYGRVKDTIPFMLGACDARVRVLNAEYALREQSKNMLRGAEGIQNVLEHVSESVTREQGAVKEIMLELNEELSMQLHKMSLEKDQEDYIFAHLDMATNRLYESTKNGESVKHALQIVLKMLQMLNDEQTHIIEKNLTYHKEVDQHITDDIELF